MATSYSERLRVLVHTQVNKSTLAAVWHASGGKINKQINTGMTKPSAELKTRVTSSNSIIC